jgi:protein SCO1/2
MLRACSLAPIAVASFMTFASAQVTEKDLAIIAASRPPPDSHLPMSVVLQDGKGQSRSVAGWLDSKPSAWIVADFTCQTLCSPVLRITADALEESGLEVGSKFNLIVLGLDAKDSAADGAAMKAAQVGTDGPLAANTAMLRGTDEAIAQVMKSFGFHATYDAKHDQFAHPAVVFIVAADGRVSRTFSGLSIEPADIRLALVEAGQGRIGTFADRVRLLCYGFDPAHGTYNLIVGRALAVGGGTMVVALALFLGLMFRRERQARR